MHLGFLFGFLLVAAVCALLAFLAGLLLKVKLPILGYVGVGLLGEGIGSWLALVINADIPGRVPLGDSGVHLVWAFVGALLVMLAVKFLPPLRK